MDGLATAEEVMAYIGDGAAGKDALVAMLTQATADQIKAYCHKTEGFKASSKLAHMKWAAREFTLAIQGGNGIASESIGGVSTTYLQGTPQDILSALQLDRRVIVK